MAIHSPEANTMSWTGATDQDYKFADFANGSATGSAQSMMTTAVAEEVSFIDGSASTLSNLLSSLLPQTSTWSTLLVTALTENLTTVANNTDPVGSTYELSLGQRLMLTQEQLTDRCGNFSDLSNCTVQEYMMYMRGPQMLPLQQAILVSVALLGSEMELGGNEERQQRVVDEDVDNFQCKK